MTAPTIKSRPVYPGLQVSPHAYHHLFVLEGEGVLALRDQAEVSGAAFLSRSDVLFLAGTTQSSAHESVLSELAPRSVTQSATLADLLAQLRAALTQARMGTRLYVAGTEGFIGCVMQVAMDFGVDAASIFTEHRGSLARRVQCVHCKGFTENVRHSPFTCSHCGLKLLVRDHYSRRLAAFQGVNIDAEAPGTAPPPEELFP